MASLVASTDGLVPRPDRPSVRDKSTEVPWSVADDAFVAGMERSLIVLLYVFMSPVLTCLYGGLSYSRKLLEHGGRWPRRRLPLPLRRHRSHTGSRVEAWKKHQLRSSNTHHARSLI